MEETLKRILDKINELDLKLGGDSICRHMAFELCKEVVQKELTAQKESDNPK